MPPISVLMKPSSGMCNMKCDYCFYCDETKKRTQQSFGFMKEETLKNIIRRTMLRAQGGISYAYQGGEPTLRTGHNDRGEHLPEAEIYHNRNCREKRICCNKYRERPYEHGSRLWAQGTQRI